MQVKKYEASSVIEALQEVKRELGPDAIIISTQEAKRSLPGSKKFVVVAAVPDHQLKKKELAEKKLGDVYSSKVINQSAQKQKMFIENVYRGLEKKHEARNRTITQTPYIDIDETEAPVTPTVTESAPATMESPQTNVARVKAAAKEAFKSSLQSDFFKTEEPPVQQIAQFNPAHPQKPPQVAGPLASMVKRLKACGVSAQICDDLVKIAERELEGQMHRRAIVDSWFAKWILSQTAVAEASPAKVEFFVGPHGAGKTSSLVKMATHFVMNENKSVAVITTDLNKVGAVEQLRVYSRILNVPVYVVRNLAQLHEKIDEFSQYDKVLIDTPGISLSNIEELDFMRGIAQVAQSFSSQVHLVLSALTKEKDLGGILKRFRVAETKDLIVTNIDQTSQHGILVNIQQKSPLPFHSFGIGSDIVDGFEMATRERVLDLVFKLTKQTGDKLNGSRI